MPWGKLIVGTALALFWGWLMGLHFITERQFAWTAEVMQAIGIPAGFFLLCWFIPDVFGWFTR